MEVLVLESLRFVPREETLRKFILTSHPMTSSHSVCILALAYQNPLRNAIAKERTRDPRTQSRRTRIPRHPELGLESHPPMHRKASTLSSMPFFLPTLTVSWSSYEDPLHNVFTPSPPPMTFPFFAFMLNFTDRCPLISSPCLCYLHAKCYDRRHHYPSPSSVVMLNALTHAIGFSEYNFLPWHRHDSLDDPSLV
jgi:hypothetical protein